MGNDDLHALTVLLLQEIICEAGTCFHEHEGWVIVYGKNEGDWRGTGILYKAVGLKHSNTRLLPVGIATTISSDKGKQGTRYLAGHIPHHATVERTEAIMQSWSGTLKKAKVVLGVDANEVFTSEDGEGLRSHTARGEAILAAAIPNGMAAPPQQLDTVTYHPYNAQHRPRRLDYVMVRGIQSQQGIARSDHDLVWVQMRTVPLPKQSKRSWGARRFRSHTDINAIVGAPLRQEDTHGAISRMSLNITVQGKYKSKFVESTALKMARKQAHGSPPQDAREAWKKVNRMRKQELRAWHNNLVIRASQVDWYAYRTLSYVHRREGWHHKLVDAGDWKQTMTKHFEGIFAKAPKSRTARLLGDTRRALALLCKITPWRPFTLDDLKVATVKWKSGKSTEPDAITHEILRYLLNDNRWGFRLTRMMNDFLYKGELPLEVLKGITVLLPKTLEDPTTWGDTRPITLSSSILKWFSQLLLKRCGGKIQDGAPYQWACRGKQAPELLVILRRVIRMAKDWGTPTWIIKLDVRKAFDSVWQETMGDMVAGRVGGLRAGGGGTARQHNHSKGGPEPRDMGTAKACPPGEDHSRRHRPAMSSLTKPPSQRSSRHNNKSIAKGDHRHASKPLPHNSSTSDRHKTKGGSNRTHKQPPRQPGSPIPSSPLRTAAQRGRQPGENVPAAQEAAQTGATPTQHAEPQLPELVEDSTQQPSTGEPAGAS